MQESVTNNKPYSDEQLAKIGSMVMRVYHKINGDPQKKMQGAKDIVFAMLKARGADLQTRSTYDQVVYRQVAEQLLKQAGGSGTYSDVPATTRSKNPGNSLGNNPAKDPPSPASEMTQQSCEDALEKSGIDDADFRKSTCAAYLNLDSGEDSGEPRGGKKNASLNPDSNGGKPVWLTAREQLFSGGSQRFETVDSKQSKSAAVIVNQDDVPAWVRTSIDYRAYGLDTKSPTVKNASQKKPTAGMQAITAWRKGGA